MGRKTITINSAIEKKLREIQSRFIKEDTKSWSLSKVVNMVLLSAMVNSNDLAINDWHNLRTYVNGNTLNIDETNTERFVENLLEGY